MDWLPPDAFLEPYPPDIRKAAEVLRAVVKRAVPEAIERVRAGWRLIGYDIPVGRRTVYFAWVAPEPGHVHIGFQVGTLMDDPDRILRGAHLRLKKVRYLTFVPGQPIPEPRLVELTREAARITALSREERLALLFDREAAPQGRSAGVTRGRAR